MTEQEMKQQFDRLNRVQLDPELIEKIKLKSANPEIIPLNVGVWLRAIAAVLVLNLICFTAYFNANKVSTTTDVHSSIYFVESVNLYEDVQ